MAPTLFAHTPTGLSGALFRVRGGASPPYSFNCSVTAREGDAVSLTMPTRPEPYLHGVLHPVFQMNLPEGYVLDQLRLRLAKSTGTDPLSLLGVMGSADPIGRVRMSLDEQPDTRAIQRGERLEDILAYKGAEGLFASLVDRYLETTAISGVQPKVLVPQASPAKAAGRTPELIVKSGMDSFPGLAINEFVCMTAVAKAGIPTPEFFLSDDRSLFVMRRFDRLSDGSALGFEDMAVLAGLAADQKYQGRYEGIAKLIKAFCSVDAVQPALAQLFDMVAMSCLLGNGDAHLKNFGLLYTTPADDDVRMAPAYDIVNTTCYLRDDALALSLGGDKGLFSSRLRLVEFATAHCNLKKAAARTRVRELMDALRETLRAHASLVAEVPGLRATLEKSLVDFSSAFGR